MKELREAKPELLKRKDNFGNDTVELYVYATRDENLTHRQERNKKRAEDYAKNIIITS